MSGFEYTFCRAAFYKQYAKRNTEQTAYGKLAYTDLKRRYCKTCPGNAFGQKNGNFNADDNCVENC